MTLSRAEVEKVALLGRLLLSPAELDAMTAKLGAIVGYIEQLSAVDTDAVEPMAHPIELRNVFREDELTPSLPRTEALQNAADQDGEYYRVPAVLGE